MVEGEEEFLKRLRLDFAKVASHPKVLGVILYGSHARGEATPRSDVDVCVVVPNLPLVDAYELVVDLLENPDDAYDVRLFEELPLHVQAAIIESGKTIASRDENALLEYFVRFRRDWEDVQVRIRRS
ncbi:MAG: nucleotidyltransferase domain-containing protein [Promethearchaeota archaeon]